MNKIQYLEDDSRYKKAAAEDSCIIEKPQFGKPLKSVEHVPEGRSVHLEATLIPVNDATMKVEWFCNGKPIPQGSKNIQLPLKMTLKRFRLITPTRNYFFRTPIQDDLRFRIRRTRYFVRLSGRFWHLHVQGEEFGRRGGNHLRSQRRLYVTPQIKYQFVNFAWRFILFSFIFPP